MMIGLFNIELKYPNINNEFSKSSYYCQFEKPLKST
jgi:hypothetical protein